MSNYHIFNFVEEIMKERICGDKHQVTFVIMISVGALLSLKRKNKHEKIIKLKIC